MSWRDWARNTAGRLGIPTVEYTGITVEMALNRLQQLELRSVALRNQLLTAASQRPLHAEEITAFDLLRHNVWNASVHMVEQLKALGVQPRDVPAIDRLAGLPKEVMQSQALGAIRIGSSRTYRPQQVMGALGGAAPVVAFAAAAIAILAGSVLLISYLTEFVHPELAQEQAITERVLAGAEAWQAYYAAIAAGADPATLEAPEGLDRALLMSPSSTFSSILSKAILATGLGLGAYLLVKYTK